MGVPISIRLDDDVRSELEAQAKARGGGLSTLVRELATAAAREARRARIREASAEVGRLVGASAEGRVDLYYEALYGELIAAWREARVVDVSDLAWTEVDTL